MVWLCLICDWTSFKKKHRHTWSYTSWYFFFQSMFNSILYFNPFQSFSPMSNQPRCVRFVLDFLRCSQPICLTTHRSAIGAFAFTGDAITGTVGHAITDTTWLAGPSDDAPGALFDTKTSCFFSWSCFSVEDGKSVKCSGARLESFWWLYTSENDNWKEPKVPAILKNSQCCLTVVWWNASFRNLLSHHSLSNLGGLQP